MRKTIINKVFLLVVVALIGLFFAISCEKDGSKNTVVNMPNNIIVEKDVPFARITYLLDSVFGHSSIASYDSVFVVNSTSELQQYINYTGPDIDFTNKTLLFGWVASPSHPSVVDSTCLIHNNSSNNYIYNVDVVVSFSGYQAIEKIYFWDIYPKINGKILLNVNYQYQ